MPGLDMPNRYSLRHPFRRGVWSSAKISLGGLRGLGSSRAVIADGATVHADEASRWDQLAANFPLKRINHQLAYSHDGACTNQAESFFSRMRRAETGIHHHIAGRYLSQYATEMAWRENTRRVSNGNQFAMLVTASAAAPKSVTWAGYGQRRHR
jgi:hypothetical protein